MAGTQTTFSRAKNPFFFLGVVGFWVQGLQGPWPLVAGFLDQEAGEGVQAGQLLNFVILVTRIFASGAKDPPDQGPRRGKGPENIPDQGLPSPRPAGPRAGQVPTQSLAKGQGPPQTKNNKERRIFLARGAAGPGRAGFRASGRPPAPKGPRAKSSVPSMKNVFFLLESILRTPPFYTRSGKPPGTPQKAPRATKSLIEALKEGESRSRHKGFPDLQINKGRALTRQPQLKPKTARVLVNHRDGRAAG